MNPATQDAITQVLTVLGPALGAFLVGHFHILLKPAAPATPGTPASPEPTTPGAPLLPAQPGNPRPIGQGGIIDMIAQGANAVAPPPGAPLAAVGQGGLIQLAGLFIQSILNGPGTTKQKAAAASAVITATEPFVAQPDAPINPSTTGS
jgi:hypothetical protein